MPPRLKILHVNPETQWGGGEVQVLELTTSLSRAGHHSVVAAHPDGVLSRRLAAAGLPVCAFAIRNHLDVPAGVRLRRLVRAGGYDLVHFHTARAHALSPWLAGVPVKRIVTRRMDYAVRRGPATRFLYTRQVDAVVAISAGVRGALLAAGVPASSIHLIPSGVRTTRFAPDPEARVRVRHSYGFADSERVVLSVGALVTRKGHHTLLQAAYALKTQGLPLRYLICGEGELRPALETEARRLGLAAEVSFAGFCPDVAHILAAGDFFVHVPAWEGLGVAVIEALAASLPVIASRVGGIPELIADRQTGLLVPPQDPPALTAALRRLVQDPPYAAALGKAGQAFARAHFDAEVMAERNEALYYRVLGLCGAS
ncbi:MAG: glycosyltransferase [Thermodesulfobacteriota bacterium]|jgi:glycosyltransferase involved in cell wall biosynthesis